MGGKGAPPINLEADLPDIYCFLDPTKEVHSFIFQSHAYAPPVNRDTVVCINIAMARGKVYRERERARQ